MIGRDWMDIPTESGLVRAVLSLGDPGREGGWPDAAVSFGLVGSTPSDALPVRSVRNCDFLRGSHLDGRDWHLGHTEARALAGWLAMVERKASDAARLREERAAICSWYFPPKWADEFDPVSDGWSAAPTRDWTAMLPGVDRRPFLDRDFWARGEDRLVMEWDTPYRVVRAVLLNGREVPVPATKAEWDKVWRRHGSDGLTSCGEWCCDGFRKGERMDD